MSEPVQHAIGQVVIDGSLRFFCTCSVTSTTNVAEVVGLHLREVRAADH